jgi:hypothetical protein
VNELRVYKFLIVPVMQEITDDGTVVAEVQPQNPDHVFGLDGLEKYAAGFNERLADIVAAQNGGT